MSGPRSPYLQRRQGIFHLRVRVPDGLKLRVGLLEVRRSLRVSSADRARLLAPTYVARLKEVFAMAEAIDLPKGEVRNLISACFADLAARAQMFVPRSFDPTAEIPEQQHWAQESVGELERQVALHQFEPWVEEQANRLLRANGLVPEELTVATRLDVRRS